MYSPPAVSYPVGRSRFEFWLISLILAFGAVVCTWWTHESEQVGWRQMTAFSVWLFAWVTSYITWRNSPEGLLVWRQESWFWTPANGNISSEIKAAGVVVHLDLQFTLLLKLSLSNGTNKWLWLEQKRLPERWFDLRRAAHGPRRVLG